MEAGQLPNCCYDTYELQWQRKFRQALKNCNELVSGLSIRTFVNLPTNKTWQLALSLTEMLYGNRVFWAFDERGDGDGGHPIRTHDTVCSSPTPDVFFLASGRRLLPQLWRGGWGSGEPRPLFLLRLRQV